MTRTISALVLAGFGGAMALLAEPAADLSDYGTIVNWD